MISVKKTIFEINACNDCASKDEIEKNYGSINKFSL